MSKGQARKRARKIVRRHLRAAGFDPRGPKLPRDLEIAEAARTRLNLPPLLFVAPGQPGSSARETLVRIAEWLRTGTFKPVKLKPLRKIAKKDTEGFYRSFSWCSLRWQILEKYGFQCMACGRSAQHGIVLHVDHIKPLRYFPELALESDNLQVLCEECNHGKGSKSQADLRPQWAALSSNGHNGVNGAGVQGKRANAGSDL